MTTTKPNLASKLAKVMASIKHVPKRGRNQFHKYDYATEADIVEAVRNGLSSEGIMLIPSAEKVEWREVQTKSGTSHIATLHVKFTLTDGNESLEFYAFGEGQDSGDKATYKAMTGAVKYALLKLFLIPTGDDPEADNGAAKAKPKAAEPNMPEPQMITGAQRKMLFAYCDEQGVSKDKLRDVMKQTLGITSTKDIPKDKLTSLTLALKAEGEALGVQIEPGAAENGELFKEAS
jgi:hypothetical protein